MNMLHHNKISHMHAIRIIKGGKNMRLKESQEIIIQPPDSAENSNIQIQGT